MAFFTILENNPNCEIILQTMNQTFGGYADIRPRLSDYYQTYRYYAFSHNLGFIDYYPKWIEVLTENPELTEVYMPGYIHPGLEGTEAVMMPILEKYIF